MNTGHDGSLSTCHANGPVDALRRLETMSLLGGLDLPLSAVREQIVGAVDLLVHVARGLDGHRRVVGVAEVADDPDDPRRVRRVAGDGTVEDCLLRPARRTGRPAWT